MTSIPHAEAAAEGKRLPLLGVHVSVPLLQSLQVAWFDCHSEMDGGAIAVWNRWESAVTVGRCSYFVGHNKREAYCSGKPYIVTALVDCIFLE
jgi:hypothetical protein